MGSLKVKDEIDLIRVVESSKLKRDKFANLLGVSDRTLYRWMAGDSRIPVTAILAIEYLISEKLI